MSDVQELNTPNDIRLVQTCGACPEQYDAYLGDEVIGYLRLRHGRFTVQLTDPTGPLVYEAAPLGDGCFMESEQEHYLSEAKLALFMAIKGNYTVLPNRKLMPDLQPIRGGWHIKEIGGGRCIDVMVQLYNWRLIIGPADHDWRNCYEHGWCYFGHGIDEAGRPRTMATAFNAAVVAALVFNGEGDPPGFDKQAF